MHIEHSGVFVKREHVSRRQIDPMSSYCVVHFVLGGRIGYNLQTETKRIHKVSKKNKLKKQPSHTLQLIQQHTYETIHLINHCIKSSKSHVTDGCDRGCAVQHNVEANVRERVGQQGRALGFRHSQDLKRSTMPK